MTLTQVSRGLVNLYYGLGKRKEADLPKQAWGVESSPSTLDLQKVTDSITSCQTLSAQAQLNPMGYKNPKCQTNSLQVTYNILGKETTRSIIGSLKRPLTLASGVKK